MDRSSRSTHKRILQELEEIRNNPLEECSAAPISDDNLLEWAATICGPCDTPFANGVFQLSVRFPVEYPHSPPHITFTTPVYHPNIDQDGEISLNILNEEWCSVLIISKILLSICSFLDDPYIDFPLVPEIAEQYRTDPDQYARVAREWTTALATGT